MSKKMRTFKQKLESNRNKPIGSQEKNLFGNNERETIKYRVDNTSLIVLVNKPKNILDTEITESLKDMFDQKKIFHKNAVIKLSEISDVMFNLKFLKLSGNVAEFTTC